MNIYEKLNEARKVIRQSKMKKLGHNEYSNYDYFTPEQIEGLVINACEKAGLMCITNLKKDVNGYFQELTLINTEDWEGKTLTFELRTEMPEMKATNAAQQMGGMDTYSERYLKMKVFAIKENALDFDSHDNRKQPESPMRTFQPRRKPFRGVGHDESLDDAQTDIQL